MEFLKGFRFYIGQEITYVSITKYGSFGIYGFWHLSRSLIYGCPPSLSSYMPYLWRVIGMWLSILTWKLILMLKWFGRSMLISHNHTCTICLFGAVLNLYHFPKGRLCAPGLIVCTPSSFLLLVVHNWSHSLMPSNGKFCKLLLITRLEEAKFSSLHAVRELLQPCSQIKRVN